MGVLPKQNGAHLAKVGRETSGSAPKGDAEEAAGSGGGEVSKRARSSAGRERDRLVVPDPLPARPVGGLGPAPEDTIKEYKRAFDDVREGAGAVETNVPKKFCPSQFCTRFRRIWAVFELGSRSAAVRLEYETP